ncbi:argonaute [Thalictrum thalictroides]|uniref:Argonaute n=1 Tax=Thalictrum thalictroides TaxID=46969 RepID=A0A7J6WDS8_THATH|nr:argonaute [Thalictrum thalictroides]
MKCQTMCRLWNSFYMGLEILDHHGRKTHGGAGLHEQIRRINRKRKRWRWLCNISLQNFKVTGMIPVKSSRTATISRVAKSSYTCPALLMMSSCFGKASTLLVVFLIRMDVLKNNNTTTVMISVTITPEVVSRGVNRAVMKDLVSLYPHSDLGGLQPVYDGLKGENLNSRFPTPMLLELINTTYNNFYLEDRGMHHKKHAIQVLDIVLREKPSNDYTVVGRSFFSLKLGTKSDAGNGLECWRGYYQCLLPYPNGIFS